MVDKRCMNQQHWWDDDVSGNWSTFKKTESSANLPITDPTWAELGYGLILQTSPHMQHRHEYTEKNYGQPTMERPAPCKVGTGTDLLSSLWLMWYTGTWEHSVGMSAGIYSSCGLRAVQLQTLYRGNESS